jgi:hypothetical protein
MPLDTLTNGRKSTKGKLRAAPSRVSTDPRVKPDDPCCVCGEPRRPIAAENEDPFCTTVCCRAWYSITDPGRRR